MGRRMPEPAPDADDVRANKRALGGWIASGWLFFFCVLFVTWSMIPEDMTLAIDSLAGRLLFALCHVFLASLLLFVGFLAVGATRWQLETADAMVNPALSGGQAAAASVNNRVHTQFLSNTTEQFVMFAAATLGAAPFFTAPYLRVITLVTILWVAGRLFFWGGYWYTASRGQPTYPRAVGLGLGLLCTLIMAGVAATGVCMHFPSFVAILEPSVTTVGVSDVIIAPAASIEGSNVFPVASCSVVVGLMSLLAVVPRVAPPVVPIALISLVSWVWLLGSGVIPVR